MVSAKIDIYHKIRSEKDDKQSYREALLKKPFKLDTWHGFFLRSYQIISVNTTSLSLPLYTMRTYNLSTYS